MIGTDPEFFVLDNKNKPVPAWRFYPPKAQQKIVKNSSYFRDGYVLELNTEPETCRGRFGNALAGVLRNAQTDLPPGYTLSTNAAMKIDLADMMTDVPPDAQVFGCDPSYNAYEEAEIQMDLDAMEHEYRYAGGHLHHSGLVGSGFLRDDHSKFLFTKLCDLFIGLPLAYLFDSEDEVLRRKYYGKAGEMRMQKYPDHAAGGNAVGIEYRTPSPKIYNDYRIASMLLGVMRNLVVHFPKIASSWCKSWDKPLQHAINNCEVSPKMLQTVSGFYTPELLVDLKKKECFNRFTFKTWQGHDYHTAFTEWTQKEYQGPPPPSYYDAMGRYSPQIVEAYTRHQQPWQKMLGYVKTSYGYGPSATLDITKINE